MADASITLRDFSGGLNTTLDANRLPPQMSGDLLNVEVLESRSIRRRSGYAAQHAAAIVASFAVKGICRFYKADGTRSWLYQCATGIYSGSDATKSSYGYVQAETLSATSATYASDDASGGSAVPLYATATTYSIPVPYSTYVTVRGLGDSFKANIDGGSFSNSTAGVVSLTGLTATTHTMTVKLTGTRNASALAVNGVAAKQSSRYKVFSNVLTPLARSHFTIKVKRAVGAVSLIAIGNQLGGVPTSCIRINAANELSVYSGGSTTPISVLADTEYHELGFYVIPSSNYDTPTTYRVDAYLSSVDGVALGINPYFGALADDLTSLRLILFSKEATTYFDSLRGNDGALLDDFGSIASWTRDPYWTSTTGGSTTADAIVGTAGNYDSTVLSLIDTVEYGAATTPTKIATVANTRPAFTTLNGKVYFSTATNAIRSWTGATVATITASGTAPSAAFITEHKRRIFAAGKSTDKSLLEYTATDSGNDWTNGGALRVTGKDAGGDCTGLITWSDLVWYFGNSRIHAIDTTGNAANWTNKAINTKFGCTAPATLTRSPNGLIFLSNGSVRAYGTIPGVNSSDGSGLLNLSKNIKGTMDRVNWSASVTEACGAFYRDRYYISLPLDGATVNNYTLVYRFATEDSPESWTLYDYGFATLYTPRGDEDALYGGGYDGRVYRLEYGSTDNGTPIALRYTIPPLTADKQGISTVKHFRRLHVAAEASSPQTLTVTPYNDDEPGQAVSLQVTSSTDSRPIRTPLNARGRSLGLVLTGTGDDQDITISEVTLTHAGARMR